MGYKLIELSKKEVINLPIVKPYQYYSSAIQLILIQVHNQKLIVSDIAV
jgi:hypothetical protein